MDASYAHARGERRELAFRLRSRAAVVARAWREHGTHRPPKLLEIGAAEGRTLQEIARRIGPGEYVGLELDEGLIAARGRLPENVQLLHGDALHLNEFVDDNSFDAVAMLALLEHLPDPAAAVAAAVRILRPGGILAASCPNPNWDRLAGRLGLVRREHHVSRVPLRELRRLMTSSGLTVLEANRFMFSPIAVLPYLGIRVSPDWALRADRWIDRIPVLKRLCANAYVVARKQTE